mgnify:CR=1 FL=1
MITFDPLWRTLASRNMNKGDLQRITGLSSTTIAKLSKGDVVKTDVVDRICEGLKVSLEEVAAFQSSNPESASNRSEEGI